LKVHTHFDAIGTIPNAVLTIGTFDGVHVGHQKIIQRLNQEAEKVGGESVLFTFFPHPRMVLSPENHGLKLLQTQAEKIAKLERMGLKHLIIYPFTTSFAATSATDFVRTFLVEKLHVHTIIVGYDHQFGKNREGSLEHLQEMALSLPFQVIEIPAHEIDEVNVSSTKIRNAILGGDVETANTYLNEPFEFTGKVVPGKALGRTIGFPTANIEIEDPLKIHPGDGVYAVAVRLENGELHQGMMNIGNRPTVDDTKRCKMEVFIFDFNRSIYNERITVYLLKYHRKEHPFDSIESLKVQLQADEKDIRNFMRLAEFPQ
jgi:riboflavin kinase/FMN adenylyltransferase